MTKMGSVNYQVRVVNGLEVLVAEGLTKGRALLLQNGLVGGGATAD